MRDYDDLIKRVQPYYNDLPVEGMKVLDELVNALRDLEAKFDNQHTELVEAKTALQPFAKFAERFGPHARDDSWQLTNNPSGKGNLTMGDVRKAKAALSLSGENSK